MAEAEDLGVTLCTLFNVFHRHVLQILQVTTLVVLPLTGGCVQESMYVSMGARSSLATRHNGSTHKFPIEDIASLSLTRAPQEDIEGGDEYEQSWEK